MIDAVSDASGTNQGQEMTNKVTDVKGQGLYNRRLGCFNGDEMHKTKNFYSKRSRNFTDIVKMQKEYYVLLYY